MRRRTLAVGWSVLLTVLCACAGPSVTLKPGQVPLEAPAGDPAAELAWSLWVQPVQDLRPNAADGAKVGLMYPRFQEEPQTVYLEPDPATYLREQLTRFLLHRGLEASEARRAKLQLRVELTEFSLAEVPGSVWDEIRLQIGYVVRFFDRTGKELGHLRVAGGRVVKTPGGAAAQAAEGFRDSLADTFPTILQSEVFQRVTQQVQ